MRRAHYAVCASLLDHDGVEPIDPFGAGLLADWIAQLKACP